MIVLVLLVVLVETIFGLYMQAYMITRSESHYNLKIIYKMMNQIDELNSIVSGIE